MQLSKKRKTFSALFSQFFKSRLNIENFEKIDQPHRLIIDEITVSERYS